MGHVAIEASSAVYASFLAAMASLHLVLLISLWSVGNFVYKDFGYGDQICCHSDWNNVLEL